MTENAHMHDTAHSVCSVRVYSVRLARVLFSFGACYSIEQAHRTCINPSNRHFQCGYCACVCVNLLRDRAFHVGTSITAAESFYNWHFMVLCR